MCGRTACTLDPHQLRQACRYTNRQGQWRRPRWRAQNQGGGNQNQSDQTSNTDKGTKKKRYYPSYNTAPQAFTPVLVSSQHFQDETPKASDDRVLMMMKWGLVPAWHKGDPAAMAYKMNNCRSEGMLEKASFKRPFEKGQRCVILADGYYEWHTDSNKKKQPYFIYFPQDKPLTELSLPESYEFDFDSTNVAETEDSKQEWTGHRLLTMAGIFDKWNPPDGSETLYTYSIITIEAAPSVSWIHHRMPVMLDGDKAVRDWLDFGTVPTSEALTLVKALDCLTCHPVTPQMGNIRYKEPDCIKQIDPEAKKEEKPKNTFMSSWLKKSTKRDPEMKPGPPQDVKEGVKKESAEKKTGLTSWLQKANKPSTLKRAMDSASPEKKFPSKVNKLEEEVKVEKD